MRLKCATCIDKRLDDEMNLSVEPKICTLINGTAYCEKHALEYYKEQRKKMQRILDMIGAGVVPLPEDYK